MYVHVLCVYICTYDSKGNDSEHCVMGLPLLRCFGHVQSSFLRVITYVRYNAQLVMQQPFFPTRNFTSR